MKKIFTIILLLSSVNVFAQSWENTGTANLQRLPTAKGYFYRNNMLTKGFANWYTSPQVDSLFLLKTDAPNIYVTLNTAQLVKGNKTFRDTTNSTAVTVIGNGTALNVNGYAIFQGGGDFDVAKNLNIVSGFRTEYFSGTSDTSHRISNTSTGLRIGTFGSGRFVEVNNNNIKDNNGLFFLKGTSPTNFVDITSNQTITGVKTIANNLPMQTTGIDSRGISWAANSDIAKIFFRSTGDVDSTSNQIFQVGDNIQGSGAKEGWIFRKNGSGDLPTPTPDVDVVKLNMIEFSWLGKGVVTSKTVATYALMISDGTPKQMTIYKILNDEHKSLTNTIYQWWPDGVRKYLTTTTD